ncbi:MAG: hypothetical protein M3347_17170 [Armatimonadota bacterium]|nr:hypothetical protein [Armatimonadota bacterium]
MLAFVRCILLLWCVIAGMTPPRSTADQGRLDNIFPFGDFETLDGEGKPAGWKVVDGKRIGLVEEDGNHFLRLFNNQLRVDVVSPILVPLEPEWRRLKVTVRMRTNALRVEPDVGSGARLDCSFVDAAGKTVAPGLAEAASKGNAPSLLLPTLRLDTEWVDLKAVGAIPPGAVALRLAPSLINTRGIADFDDIQVVPNPPLDASPIRAGLPEGTFEQTDEKGNPVGWNLAGWKMIRVMEENGNHFLRIENRAFPNDYVMISSRFKLDPIWQRVKIALRMRTRDLKVGKQPWNEARLWYAFEDENGKEIGAGPFPALKKDSDWVALEVKTAIPKNAVHLKLTPAMLSTTGIADFDDIQITGNPPLDARTIEPGFPEGTFEQVNDKGNPLGWSLGDQKLIKLVEEKGNRFLRIENDAFPKDYVTTSSRFKLDPTWKKIRVAVRMRGRNLKPGKQPWNEARLWTIFEDENGKEVSTGPLPALKKDSDWVSFSERVNVPPKAVYLKLTPAMLSTLGVADFDDIVVEPVLVAEEVPPLVALSAEEAVQQLAKPTLVALHFKNASAHKVLAELSKQSGVPLRFSQDENSNPLPPVTIDVDNVPTWEAIRTLARQLRLGAFWSLPYQSFLLYPETGYSLSGAADVRGPVLVVASFADRPVPNWRPQLAGQKSPDSDQNIVILTVFVDPRLPVGNRGRLKITEAQDEQGHALPQPMEHPVFFNNSMATSGLPLPAVFNAATRIERLKGSLHLPLITKSHVWEVPNILESKGATTLVGNLRFTIEDVKKNGGTYELLFNIVRRDPKEAFEHSVPELSFARQFRLQDDKGRALIFTGTRKVADDGNERRLLLTFRRAMPEEGQAALDIGEPSKLIAQIPREVKEVEVPFEVSGLQVPPPKPPLVVLSPDEAMRMLGGPNLVTLHFNEAPLATVLAELSRQAGVALHPWPDNPDETWPPVTIDLDRQPFWEAMRILCQQLKLRVEWSRPEPALLLMKGSDSKLEGPMVVSQPMHFVVNSVERRRSAEPQGVDEEESPGGTPGGTIKISALVDPRLRVANWGTLYMEEFKDDKGNRLESIAEHQLYFGGYPVSTFTIPLPPLAEDSKSITAKGVLRVRVMTKGEVWEVPHILQAKGVSKTVGNELYTITEVTKSGSKYTVHLAIAEEDPNIPLYTPRALRFNFLRLVDNEGRDLFRQFEDYIAPDGRRVRINFARTRYNSKKEEAGEPAKLLVEIPRETKMLDVPLELANLPLPPLLRATLWMQWPTAHGNFRHTGAWQLPKEEPIR